jgi:hypothetical protein
MAMNQALLGEFDHEMANTRKSLERVPDGKFDWKPHTKSMTMGALATHIASIPHWGKMTLDTPSFDVNPPGGQQVRQPELKSKAEVLAFFDKSVPEARAAIANATDQSLMSQWSLLNGGKTVFTMPRIGVLRNSESTCVSTMSPCRRSMAPRLMKPACSRAPKIPAERQ